MDTNRPQEAIVHLEHAIAFEPVDGIARYLLAQALARAGHSDRDRPLFRKAAEIRAFKYLDQARCPGCGWIPDGSPFWECGKCSEEYDTFASRGKCPKCSKEATLTQCVGCGKRDRHESFWL